MSRRRSSVTPPNPVQATVTEIERPPASVRARYLIPWLLLFAGSGCAALIYEIVWFRLLEFVIGSSGASLGLLLAAYMGGLCVGSVALPRLVSGRHNPMQIYACLEAGIAALGII